MPRTRSNLSGGRGLLPGLVVFLYEVDMLAIVGLWGRCASRFCAVRGGSGDLQDGEADYRGVDD